MNQNNTKVLLIIDCTDALLWYRDKIGQHVPFVREEDDCYLSREDEGYVNIVFKKDAKLLDAP